MKFVDIKIIIISDVKGNTESIIPYGLQLAKFLESEVDILHIVDSRIQQGVSIIYGDSQSMTPGRKLSPHEVMKCEKHHVEKELNDLLSREASRLNCPLKINVVIEEENVEERLKFAAAANPETIFVINKGADHYMFESKKYYKYL